MFEVISITSGLDFNSMLLLGADFKNEILICSVFVSYHLVSTLSEDAKYKIHLSI